MTAPRSRCALVLPLMAAVLVLAASSRLRAGAPDEPDSLAQTILDDAKPRADREAIIAGHPELSAALITAMTRDLPADAKEEYRRIPWIWRVAIAAGKRNDPAELRRLLDVALPKPGQPLRDWQAVVIGGGLINGVSLIGAWPAERFEALVRDDADLAARWKHALDLAATMADNEQVPTGTRYDALRLLGVEPWDRRGAQLFRYLLKGVHPELQMGAISGLADVRSPGAAQALLSGLEHYTPPNRALMLDALLRDDSRVAALLDAVAAGRLKPADLGPDRIARLTSHPQETLRKRARELLKAN